MLLALDIGNTNIVIGIFDSKSLKHSFRVASNRNLTSDEAGFYLTGLLQRESISSTEITQIVIGSVVPRLTSVFESTARKYFDCSHITVSANIELPIGIEIDEPGEVGADRIANAVAAFHKFKGEAIVVDFGTATTFDVVSSDGDYVGGIIIPGPETAMSELARRAARLFEVRIERPDSVVGKSTAGALKSGLFYGTVGQVDYIIEKIIDETGYTDAKIIATGGLAAGIEKYSRFINTLEPNLTLDGLRLIGEKEENQK